MKPWETQKKLGNMDLNIPSVAKVTEIVYSISNPMERCLVGLTYLTGGRISELIRTNRYRGEMDSIKREQIDVDTLNGHKILKIRFRTLKKRRDKKDTSFRIVPIPLDVPEYKKILLSIWPYIKSLGPEDELFPFQYTKARNIIKEHTGWNCHWIRHIRTYHLLTVGRFREEMIRIYMGWEDLRPLSRYSSIKWMDILPEYYKDENTKNG